ncbi:MAG TPA: hypothetical protein VEV63_16610 [Streptosporangiaceae bacterium]|nr:hypothetical protein [Streptosporangiaceae bacterium]
MHLVAQAHSPGVLAMGPQATGIFAFGQFATGVFAFGQGATGVIAIGQFSRGVIAVGQLAFGVIAIGQVAFGIVVVGQLAIGVLWAAGMAGVGAFAGPSLVVFGFFGRLTRHRLMVWLRRIPHDRIRFPVWRLALGVLYVVAAAAGWGLVIVIGRPY